MPAAPPGVLFISTITDGTDVILRFEVDWDSTTGALTGGSYENYSGRTQSVAVMDNTVDPPSPIRSVSIPVTTAPVAVSAQRLRQAGFSTADDCAGITFVLAP